MKSCPEWCRIITVMVTVAKLLSTVVNIKKKKNCHNPNQLDSDSADSSGMRDETVPKASGCDTSIAN